ncbi:MAG TPA: amino acid carrier protein [Marinilabiliales bacterium]|nr:MAG: amino acid carrier protein [Bacteroidetes bacterium GWC2_40_13]OFX73014.1 MAG: amino acid carrier protein [Bacteroidetes bacterium GWD2_40_43]OFX92644.1 MAG: amino acid carrier protein [Bacteroidetes bacterium GWE2_40_63]OFY17501.1 MAG: amino acid carrier protein [Bacteroidetes bacterium GWF2_40_13]OFZ27565.1 MAG: amino acid carrier protein [Bacteroidetes bacterium RIFOXYC2_FULL_40_12]HAM97218.1 amino acid carrier protein [Marinilabiliales bacterium]
MTPQFNFKVIGIAFLFQLFFAAFHAQAETVTNQDQTVQMTKNPSVGEKINLWFSPIVDDISNVLFFDPFAALGIYDPIIYQNGEPVKDKNGMVLKRRIPFVVIWLVLGAIFFTLFFRFINFRGFKLAIALIRGKYDNPDHAGQVSHFQALSTALSATVGLGNIAGVAIAISIGGPGATFWMVLAGFLGMSTKFVECTLAVKYREIDAQGRVSGGPMYYLSKGFAKRNMKILGQVVAVVFALLVVFGSLGIGNMFQANQAFSQITYNFPALNGMGFWFGLFMAFLTGIVIIGGIKSIANVTSKIVPFMAIFYISVALFIIIINIDRTGEAFKLIFGGAFSPEALKGGVIGVLIVGFQRAAFSNEAGIGSAPIAHSVARTNEPVSEGLVSLLEPFIDTVVICTMTALVLVYTGFYANPEGLQGSQLTSAAFESVVSWFPYLLIIAVFLFAYSTMISWSFYGLKGFDFLVGRYSEKWFGNRKISNGIYQVLFLVFIVIGASSNLGSVMDFSDMLILTMAFPNILGLIIMAPEVKRDLKSYLKRIQSGEIKRFR